MRSKYSDIEIKEILNEVIESTKVTAICRKYGITDTTYYNWKKKFSFKNTRYSRRNRYSDKEIEKILREVTEGAKVKSICHKYGITDTTFYRWKRKACKH